MEFEEAELAEEQPELSGEESSLEASAPSQTEQTEEIAIDEPESERDEIEKQDKSKEGIQKRFNQITAEKYAAKREAEQIRKELEQLKAQQHELRSPPSLDEFDYDEEAYLKAREAYLETKVRSEVRSEEQAHLVRQSQEQASRDFAAKVEKANIPDFQEAAQVLLDTFSLPEEIVVAIQHDEKGPEIVHYLGNHLDEAETLLSMPLSLASLKLGKLSAKLADERQRIKTTKAPPPVQTLRSTGKATKSYEDMSMEEIMRIV